MNIVEELGMKGSSSRSNAIEEGFGCRLQKVKLRKYEDLEENFVVWFESRSKLQCRRATEIAKN